MVGEADLAGDAQRLGLVDAALELHARSASTPVHAVEMFEEVEVPEGAAELAVRDRLEPDLLLLLDERADFARPRPPSVRRGDLALRELFARLLQRLGCGEGCRPCRPGTGACCAAWECHPVDAIQCRSGRPVFFRPVTPRCCSRGAGSAMSEALDAACTIVPRSRITA